MEKKFLREIACVFIICLMLNLSFYPGFAEEGMPSSTGNATTAPAPTAESRTQFNCKTPESNPEEKVLKPEEVLKLKEKTEIESDGINIDKIDTGKGSNPDRADSTVDMVVQTTDNNSAILNEVPDKKMDLGEVPWLKKYIQGPFAFGVSLYDTVRIGQCRNLSELEAAERGCPLTDKQLSLRNSGYGISNNFKNVYNDVKDFVTDDILGNPKETGQYTKEELEQLQLNLLSEDDLNTLEAKTVSRNVEHIPNSVKAEGFKADMATNCSENSCLISSYSFFDKYFNSWFSAEMVISNFGPTLLGQAKRYMGWMRRRGWPWDMADNELLNKFRRTFMNPDSLLGKARIRRMVTRTDKYGFGEVWTPMIECTDWDSGYKLIKGGSARKLINDMAKPGGYFDALDDPVRKGEFFKLMREVRGFARTQKAIVSKAADDYADVLKRFGPGSPEARSALIEYGRTNAKALQWMDDSMSLDASEWWTRDDYAGLYDVAVKHLQSDTIHPLTGDSHHIDSVMNKFIESGDWKGFDSWGSKAYATTPEGFLRVYKIDPAGEFIGEVTVEDLQKNFSHFVDKAAMTEKGELIRIDGSSLDYIVKEAPGHGSVKVYKAGWKEIDPETPERFAGRLTHSRVKGRIAGNFPENMERMYDALVERNFAGKSRHYYSLLDKAFAQEDEILKSYFSITGGAKWTIAPYVYWGAKSGIGFEGISAYQLPDTWNSVEIYTSDAALYDDAFVDFFAQHGSDEGDIFSQVLDKLPWKMVYNYVWDNYLPAKESYDKLTKPGSGWRRDVENIAYFTSTPDECKACGFSLMPNITTAEELEEFKKTGEGTGSIGFKSNQEMKSYILEDVITDEAKEEGTTLIAFGHHTNLRGDSPAGEKGIEGGEINLVEAQKEKETCADKVKGIGLGFLGDDPQRAAGLLAFGESALYVMFFWSGIIGSVVQQTLIIPDLQDCVDDQEGYYLHMFAPTRAPEENTSPNQQASEKAGDIIKNVTDFVTGKSGQAEQGQSKSFYEQAKDQIALKAKELSDKAKTSTILQASVETMGQTDGILFFEELFFFWFKGRAQAAAYDKETKTFYRDTRNDINLLVDNEAGKISIASPGKPMEDVITSPDHVRLANPSSDNASLEIPQRIGQVELPNAGPNANAEMFSLDTQGNLTVHPIVLDCIKRNVEQQTGVPLLTNKVTDAFGAVEAIVTTSHPRIEYNIAERSITATGTPREIVYGASARAVVYVNRKTVLSNSHDLNVGLFQSIQFENGIIVYKPETNELLIWLRYHKDSILEQGDAAGLKATPTTYVNPETLCPEPAIDLEAIPNLEAGQASIITERVDNFNAAMEKMGPFQMFDTEKHRFIFYSIKKTPDCNPSAPDCCENRVKIIDKETGEVIDEPMIGNIEKTPTGVKFTTMGEDGQPNQHTLDFSAENGIPKVSYNGMPAETLLSARGPNGSFWYDPETGRWYPENAQLIPLSEAFRQGFDARHRDDCSVSTTGGGNSMSVQFGAAADMPFNLPSLPEQPVAMLLFVVSMLAVIVASRVEIEKRLRR